MPELTLHQKQTLIKHAAENTMSHGALAEWASQQFDCKVGCSTVSGLLKRKSDFDDIPEAHHDRKRLCKPAIQSRDEELMEVLEKYKRWHANASITGRLIVAVAKRLFGENWCGFSRGWLGKFQKRVDLALAVRHGESASVCADTVHQGRIKLRAIIAKYDARDVYNMDETSFFYLRGRRTTLATSKESRQPRPSKRPRKKATRRRQVSGKKESKARITMTVCTNMDGSDRLPLLFIGTAKRPLILRGANANFREELGVLYEHSQKAWMTEQIFRQWLEHFNDNMKQAGRNILLIMDNVRSHKVQGMELSNIRVEFLPKNTTSVMQPLDQGIIKALKDAYYNEREEADLELFFAQKPFKPGDLYDAIKAAALAWKKFEAPSIVNCWQHAGLVPKTEISFWLNPE